MACRVCPGCERRWPVTPEFFRCPLCTDGPETRWSGAPPTASQTDVKKGEEFSAKYAEIASDLAKLEKFAAGSHRLLSFPVGLKLWPTASDVPGPFIRAEPKA